MAPTLSVKWFLHLLISPVSAFLAPMRVHLDIFSRWPLYASHGPAGEIWSVVHFPATFTRTGRSTRSRPSHGANGRSSCRRRDWGSMLTRRCVPSAGGSRRPSWPRSKPAGGRSIPSGGANWKGTSPGSLSVTGLKDSDPANAMAVTISGDARNECVAGFPSLRPAKLRLKEHKMELGVFTFTSSRCHCPMQGPQALAYTRPPTACSVRWCPSRSIVARICSDPGVTRKGTLAFRP
mmetsp:Transcript_31568/g.79175  ORF Transcript_31568/g.79175 Transcript_31568/m.79175 type:complete len:236 (+) Transcript_31568:298-1005(+)